MNDLINKLRNIPTDKQGHFGLGGILAAIVFVFATKLSGSPLLGLLLGTLHTQDQYLHTPH
jgi:hypothetical protein